MRKKNMGESKRIKLYGLAFAGMVCALFASCTDENLYNPDYVPGLRPEKEYFDFSMRSDVKLNLNFGELGAFSSFEVYDENPMKEVGGMQVKNADLRPIFAGFLNKNGMVESQFPISKALKKVFVCTSSPFLPVYEELDVNNGEIVYLANGKSMKKSQRAVEDATVDFPSGLVENPVKNQLTDKHLTTFYSLTEFDQYGKPTTPGFTRQTADSKELLDLYKRISMVLPKNKNNSHLAQPASVVNININNIEDPKKPTNITLTFVAETASFLNVVGYYYYKTGTTPDLDNIPKYLVIPNVSDKNSAPFIGSSASSYPGELAPIERGATSSLQFFGENYDEPATYDFPSGYTIGWAVVCNGFNVNTGDITYKSYATARVIYSNEEKNGLSRFLTLYDPESKKLVVGFEDGGSGEDYGDALFFVDANPIKSITTPEIPSITIDEYSETDYDYSGTYAFEDIWPSGGDYDMNDVVVEYATTVTKAVKRVLEQTTVNGKPVTNVVDQKEYIDRFASGFHFVHDGANFNNAFGLQLDNMSKDIVKEVKLDNAVTSFEEGNTNPSIIISKNAREATAQSKTHLLNVKFNEEAVKTSVAVQKNFNPFIVINNNGTASNRKEVHLPKFKTTSLGFNELNINQFYVDGKTGRYSFAFDIPIHNFNVVTEQTPIDNEYPNFLLWVDSKGEEHTDWYVNKKK